jgi:hypothetical protein
LWQSQALPTAHVARSSGPELIASGSPWKYIFMKQLHSHAAYLPPWLIGLACFILQVSAQTTPVPPPPSINDLVLNGATGTLGGIAIGVGLFYCLFGYKVFRLTLFVAGGYVLIP